MEPILKVKRHQRLLRRHPRHQGRLLRGASRRGRDPDRRQRRRQIHHPEDRLRPAPLPHRLHRVSGGEPGRAFPAHKVVAKGLAQVPEGRRIFLQMTVRGEPGDGRLHPVRQRHSTRIWRRSTTCFPRLKERRRQIAGTLSGGEQQMLAMGRALMSHPKLLMLDEPSMGLAPILVEQIFEIIQNPPQGGHHHPAGGAERPGGPERGRPGLCAGDRKDRHLRHRRGTAVQPCHQKGLSGRLRSVPSSRKYRLFRPGLWILHRPGFCRLVGPPIRTVETVYEFCSGSFLALCCEN